MKKNILFSVILLVLISLNLVSAYNGGYTLSDYLDNEWVVFTLIFLLLFTVIYFSVYKTTENKSVSGIIGATLSLLISVSILKKGMMSGLFGDTLTNLMGFFGIIIAIFIIFSLFIYYMGFLWGIFGGLITITGFLIFIDFEKFIPSGFQVSPVSMFLFLLEDLGNLTGTILIVAGIVVLFWKHRARIRQGIGIAGRYGWRGTKMFGKGVGKGSWGAMKGSYKLGGKWAERNIAKDETNKALAEQKRKEMERRNTEIKRKQIEERKLIEYKQRKMIDVDIKGLIRAYNEIQRNNPGDPRLRDIASQIKELRRQRK